MILYNCLFKLFSDHLSVHHSYLHGPPVGRGQRGVEDEWREALLRRRPELQLLFKLFDLRHPIQQPHSHQVNKFCI